MPDSMTNILFRPSISWNTSDGRNTGLSAQFNDDPYEYVDDPLQDAFLKDLSTGESKSKLNELQKLVNSQENSGLSYSDNNNMKGMLQYNRKLNSQGRNITFRADAKYTDKDSKSISLKNTRYYLAELEQGKTHQISTVIT